MERKPHSFVSRSQLQRRSRAAVAERKALRARFDRCGAVIFVLPPYVMAHVPKNRFAVDELAAFLLRPPQNQDTPRP